MVPVLSPCESPYDSQDEMEGVDSEISCGR